MIERVERNFEKNLEKFPIINSTVYLRISHFIIIIVID